jgi:hypothetical protein
MACILARVERLGAESQLRGERLRESKREQQYKRLLSLYMLPQPGSFGNWQTGRQLKSPEGLTLATRRKPHHFNGSGQAGCSSWVSTLDIMEK